MKNFNIIILLFISVQISFVLNVPLHTPENEESLADILDSIPNPCYGSDCHDNENIKSRQVRQEKKTTVKSNTTAKAAVKSATVAGATTKAAAVTAKKAAPVTTKAPTTKATTKAVVITTKPPVKTTAKFVLGAVAQKAPFSGGLTTTKATTKAPITVKTTAAPAFKKSGGETTVFAPDVTEDIEAMIKLAEAEMDGIDATTASAGGFNLDGMVGGFLGGLASGPGSGSSGGEAGGGGGLGDMLGGIMGSLGGRR